MCDFLIIKLPIKSDEESYLVDYMSEISNLELLQDLAKVADCLAAL